MNGVIETVKISTGEEITIKKPTVLQVRSIENIENESEQAVTMLSNLTGKTVEDINGLYYDDYLLLSKPLEGFMESGGRKQEQQLQ